MDSLLNIFVCSRSFARSSHLRTVLESLSQPVRYTASSDTLSGDALVQCIRDAHVVIVGLETISREIIRQCPNLKVVCKMGTGIDKIDHVALDEAGIAFFHTPGFNVNAVAELVLAQTISLLRRFKLNSDRINDLTWRPVTGFELHGKTIGLVGFGAIARRVSDLMLALRCRVLAFDIERGPIESSEGVAFCPLDRIFTQSDVVSIHLPLDHTTRGIVTSKHIAQLRPGAVLINTSRGGVVDEVALKARLAEGDIYAGLDVLDNEPYVDWELAQMPNVVLTPHIGGSTYEAIEHNGSLVIDFLSKHPLFSRDHV